MNRGNLLMDRVETTVMQPTRLNWGLTSPRNRALSAMLVAICLLASSALASGQQPGSPPTTPPANPAAVDPGGAQPRSQPAPWRPNFGSAVTVPQSDGSTSMAPDTVSGTPSPTPPTSTATSGAGALATPISGGAASQSTGGIDVGFQTNGFAAAVQDRLPEGARPTPSDGVDNAADSLARVTRKLDKLPNDAGQIWREYDITPYTSRIADKDDPQQAVIDWILQETGTEMWFSQPLGILYADRYQLYVYHTPQVHGLIKPIVDRFVHSRGKVQNLQISLVTVGRPNWRSNAYPLMQAIDVHTPGIEAWLLSKENAAHLKAQLDRRLDTQRHIEGILKHHDGQPVELSNRQPVQFLQRIRWLPGQYPGFEPILTTVNEGYTLRINSLSDLDGVGIEASIECDVDQVEKLTPVNVDIPAVPGGSAGRMTIQVPQTVNWRVRERFRWPGDQVLLLSCGVVANPKPSSINAPIPDILRVNRSRVDALLFIEYRGPDAGTAATPDAARTGMAPVAPRR